MIQQLAERCTSLWAMGIQVTASYPAANAKKYGRLKRWKGKKEEKYKNTYLINIIKQLKTCQLNTELGTEKTKQDTIPSFKGLNFFKKGGASKQVMAIAHSSAATCMLTTGQQRGTVKTNLPQMGQNQPRRRDILVCS